MTTAAAPMTKVQRERREKELTWELSHAEPRVQCAVQGHSWQEVEADVREAARAKMISEAQLHARSITPFCDHCSVAGMCKEWAEVSRYTGVAGGQLMVLGREVKGG